MSILLVSKTAYPIDIPLYFGVDGRICHIRFLNDFGGNILKRTLPGISPFIGFNLNKIFSIETGYQYLRASKVSTLAAGEYAAGTPIIQLIAPITFKSTVIFKSPYVSLLASTPICERYPIQFFCGLGISQTRSVFKRKTLKFAGLIGNRTRKMEVSHSLMRITLGANYFFNENFAIRGTMVLINTRKLHAFGCDGHNPCLFSPEIKPRNSICYGIGLRWGI